MIDLLFAVLAGLFNRWGGEKNKLFRKIGMPIIMLLFGLCHQVAWYWCIISTAIAFGAATCPITKTGDSLYDHWFNWVWIYVVGLLWGLATIVLNFGGWLYSLAYALLYGTLIVFSNLKFSRDWVKWETFEPIYGMLLILTAVKVVYGL